MDENVRVDSIRLTQQNDSILLVNRNNRWSINEILPVRKRAMDHFFNVLTGLKIEAPATRESREEILDLIRQNPIKVHIYREGTLIKNYLVEDSKYKKGITYMMMQNDKEPFLVNLPNYQGDIADLYRVDASYWRDRNIFRFSGIDIERVKIEYLSASQTSFELTYRKDKFEMKIIGSENSPVPVRSDKASRFYSYFSDVRYEEIIHDPALLDSLRNQDPFCDILVEGTDRKSVHLQTYRKKSEGGQDAFGQKSKYDLNYLYGLYDGIDEIMLIKYTEIDPLFKEIDYFRQ